MAPQPSTWRGSSDQIPLNQVGCEARKTPAEGDVFFLDIYLYRTNRATSMSFWSRCCSNCIAFCIRHSVTYSSGVCPSSSLKLAADAERDMPAVSARDSTVQGVFTLS